MEIKKSWTVSKAELQQAMAEHFKNERIRDAAPEMLEALRGLLERYVGLVNSGDAGFWNPEEEAEVIAARAAIAKAEGEP